MRALSDHDILWVWEVGQQQHPIDRALTLLEAACPEMGSDELIALSVGRRDECLLTARELTVGRSMTAYTKCPKCRHQLQFSLDTTDLRTAGTATPEETCHTLSVDGYDVEYRLPDSRDLAAIVKYKDVKSACDRLTHRCILHASKGNTPVAVEDLPQSAIDAVNEEMEKLDPLAYVELNLTCKDCGHEWPMMLDIASYFWTEIAERAKFLLLDVVDLARAYGWTEAEIVGMSPARRRFYMEQIT